MSPPSGSIAFAEKLTSSGAVPDAGSAKACTAGAPGSPASVTVTVTDSDASAVPSETVTVAVYSPGSSYVKVGSSSSLVSASVPSTPKSHAYVSSSPSASVASTSKSTASGASPSAGVAVAELISGAVFSSSSTRRM